MVTIRILLARKHSKFNGNQAQHTHTHNTGIHRTQKRRPVDKWRTANGYREFSTKFRIWTNLVFNNEFNLFFKFVLGRNWIFFLTNPTFYFQRRIPAGWWRNCINVLNIICIHFPDFNVNHVKSYHTTFRWCECERTDTEWAGNK